MKKVSALILITLLIYNCSNESAETQEEQLCDNGTFVGLAFLSTQQEVDDFGAMCYTKIDGSLSLYDINELIDKIIDLSPLSNLTEVYSETYPDSLFGTIAISTSVLEDLQGLNNISKVARLRIFSNEGLTSLNGLQGLQSIDGINYGFNALQIKSNIILQNIDALENLTHVGQSEYWANVVIAGNPSLENINGLQGLSEIISSEYFVAGNLSIYSNHQLANVNGLSNLTNMHGGRISFVTVGDLIGADGCAPIAGNNSLIDFCGLQNVLSNGDYGGFSTGSFGNCYENFAPTAQDIIDGNCSQ